VVRASEKLPIDMLDDDCRRTEISSSKEEPICWLEVMPGVGAGYRTDADHRRSDFSFVLKQARLVLFYPRVSADVEMCLMYHDGVNGWYRLHRPRVGGFLVAGRATASDRHRFVVSWCSMS